MFGGKNGFFNTFKPGTYLFAIQGVYSFILAAVIFILSLLGLADMNVFLGFSDTEFGKTPIAQIIFSVLIGLVSFIHITYAEVIGLSQFQKLTKWKALLAIFVPILLLVIGILIILFLLAYFGVLSPDLPSMP